MQKSKKLYAYMYDFTFNTRHVESESIHYCGCVIQSYDRQPITEAKLPEVLMATNQIRIFMSTVRRCLLFIF